MVFSFKWKVVLLWEKGLTIKSTVVDKVSLSRPKSPTISATLTKSSSVTIIGFSVVKNSYTQDFLCKNPYQNLRDTTIKPGGGTDWGNITVAHLGRCKVPFSKKLIAISEKGKRPTWLPSTLTVQDRTESWLTETQDRRCAPTEGSGKIDIVETRTNKLNHSLTPFLGNTGCFVLRPFVNKGTVENRSL